MQIGSLSSLFGSEIKLVILLYLTEARRAYPREIASRFNLNVFGVQNQLKNMEGDEIVKSEMLGTLRMYELNTAHPIYSELKALFSKIYSLMPKRLQNQIRDKKTEDVA